MPLFEELRDVGAELLWLHTYGQRFVPTGRHRGQIPKGTARCTTPVPGDAANYPDTYEFSDATKTLYVGGGAFAPVAPDVYNFEVSGLKVVQSWLGYRMKNPKGKKSSPARRDSAGEMDGRLLNGVIGAAMDIGSDGRRVPQTGQAAVGGGEETESADLGEPSRRRVDAGSQTALDDEPCFHASELPPVPHWARKPPKPAEPSLFDFEG